MENPTNKEMNRLSRIPDSQNPPIPNKESTLTCAFLKTPMGWIRMIVYDNLTYSIQNTSLPVGRHSFDSINEIQFPALTGWMSSVITAVKSNLAIPTDDEKDEVPAKPEN
jgi:hypothetical protein